MAAAKHFFQQAVDVVGSVREQVTTDGHTSYPRAIREIMGSDVLHRKNKYLNNGLEQDHRGIKQRYYPMRGFGTFEAAARFCCAFDELRNYFRLRHTTGGWGLTLRTATGFSPTTCCPAGIDTSSLVVRQVKRRTIRQPWWASVFSVLTEPFFHSFLAPSFPLRELPDTVVLVLLNPCTGYLKHPFRK